MGTQGALVHTTQGGIRYMAYYAQGGPIPLFHRAEAINSSLWDGLLQSLDFGGKTMMAIRYAVDQLML